jgi:carbonic anhydrase
LCAPLGAAQLSWGYAGGDAPERWGRLRADFKECALGKQQSPIDLVAPERAELNAVGIAYQDTAPLHIVNDGHTIKVKYAAGSMLRFQDRVYPLKEFHFHLPSEHTREGRRYAMEAHIVHEDANLNVAVLGVFLQAGAANATIERIWTYMPRTPGERIVPGVQINASGIVPAATTPYFTYMGSLTTPPCGENVRWVVAAQPITVSEEQIHTFRRVIGDNARPLQPLNQRLLLERSFP